MRCIKMLIFFLLLFGINELKAQTKVKRTNKFYNYKDNMYEIGFANSLSYLKYEGTFAPYLRLHFSKKINNFFYVGVGYGSIYDEHFHNNFNVETAIKINNVFKFVLKPGMAFKHINGKREMLYSVGFELVSEFKITDIIHIGPVAEINFLQNDTNYLLGFHMGFTF